MNPIYRALTLSLAFFLVFSIKTFSYDISFSVDVDSGCVPLTVTFTNTSSDTAGRSFEWDFGDGEWGEGFEVTHTYKNAGFFNPQLHDWSCCSSGPREIRVSGADTFNISTGLEACPNEKITFTAYNDDYNWIKWDFGDGESETWNNVSHKYQTPGQYNITLLYNSNECGLDSVTQTMNISDTADAPASEAWVDGHEHCPNDAIRFGLNNSYGLQYDSVEWDFGDFTTSNEVNPKHAYTTTGIKNIIFKGWNTCGNFWSDTLQVTIKNNIEADASFDYWQNSSIICPNNKVRFQAYGSGNYIWDFGDGSNTATSQEPTHFFSDTGTYQVQLIVTNSCNKSDTTEQEVFVGYEPDEHPSVNAYFSDEEYEVNSITICPGQNVNFHAESWDSDDNIYYLWDFGDGYQNSQKSTSHIFDSTGTFNVMLIATNNCLGKDTSYLEVVVDATTKPDAQFMVYQDTICTGEKMYYGAKWDVIQDSLYSFSLWFGDGDSLVNTNNWNDELGVFSHVYDLPGNYIYTLTAKNVCNNLDSLVDTVVVTDNSSSFEHFYMVQNSTVEMEDPTFDQIPDWSQPSSPNDHVFNIPVTWNQWEPGMEETFYLIMADHEITPGKMPDALIEFDGPGTVTAYIPDSYDSITFLSTWYCNGIITYEPEAMGFLDSTYIINTGDTTNVPFPGIEIEPENNWDGTCDDESGCPDDTVAFVAIGGSSYEWHFGDGETSNQALSKHVYNDTGTYNAFVIITDGCGDKDTINSTVLIGTTNKPNADFHINDDNVCLNDTFQVFGDEHGDFMETHNESYFWDFGDGTTSTETDPKHAYSKKGNYNISLTVTNGCGSSTYDDRYIYVEGPNVDFTASDTLANTTQSINFSNLSEDAVSYEWDFGDLSSSTLMNPSHTYPVKGKYDVTLTATSNRGCSASLTKEKYINVIELPVIAEYDIQNISCNGLSDGAIDITVTQGEPPYEYKWSNGEETQDIKNLSVDKYIVTITDKAQTSIIDSFNITEPDSLKTTSSGNNITCKNGSDGTITLSTTGGTTPYKYQWLSGDTTQNLNNLNAGTYHFTVTDHNGCIIIDSVTRTDTANIFTISMVETNTSGCGTSDGEATANVNGPNSYSFLWNDPSSQTTQSASSLVAGNYKVIVTDDISGCKDSAFADINESGAPSIYLENYINPQCNGDTTGNITVTVTGGAKPYNFEWNSIPTDNDSILDNVSAGNYSLTVTDFNGCIATESFSLTQPDSLSAYIATYQPSCYHGLDGYAIAHVSGGTKPYRYIGFPDEYTNNSGNKIAGTYNVTIQDYYNCELQKSYTITEPNPLSIDTSIYDVTVRDSADGSINITMLNGTPPYTYNWSNGESTQDISNLSAGTYSLTINDKNSCSNTFENLAVNQPALLNISITANGPTNFCNGQSVTLDAGAGYTSYAWSTGETTQTIPADTNMTYHVTTTSNTSYGYDSINVNVQYPYEQEQICIVTVDITTGNNLVVWEKTPDKGTDYYNVYRQDTIANQFVKIGQVPYNDTTMFVDLGSEHENHSEIYKITAVDTCGNESDIKNSPAHKTLFLQYNGFNKGVNLTWSQYTIDGSPIDFDSYKIYRGISDSTSLAELTTLAGNLYQYTDDSQVAIDQNKRLYYRVGGVRSTQCDPKTNLKASSGPFSQSISNLEDNRLKENQIVKNLSSINFSIEAKPNPFKNNTTINYQLTKEEDITIDIITETGSLMAQLINKTHKPGDYTLEFNANKYNCTAGVYYLRMSVDSKKIIKKLVILR